MINKVINLIKFILFSLFFLSFNAQAAGTFFIITPQTAEATFTGQYLGLTTFNGQFQDISGTIFSDPEKPNNDHVQISIQTCSVEMLDQEVPNQDLAAKVKSSSFLDCLRYPQLSFQSTATQWRQGSEIRIKGLLTLHGITREVELTTKFNKQNSLEEKTLNFQGEISLNRLDFGVGSRFSIIDDEITISFNLNAIEDTTLK
ncbi:YceI family protein [Kiloniella antarctica]|uniref:YceI family protein n=1 Tax=Kiloniella antarctica TaxID=1550907 RepID=A0ABW5BFV4_9PROT